MRKVFAWVLAVLLCVFALPALATEVDRAPLTQASSSRNGMVRVYLSSLGNPTTLNVTVAGNYTADGSQNISLTTGETIRIAFNTSTGNITITAGGKEYAMGQEVALRRHAATGTNGIRIAQAKKSGNLYPGDLRLVAKQSGSTWRLYPIVYVFIEDYLCGVVPYEMGNSAQIEALKAQAVAARTYTLNKMNQRASGLYDVVDTTNDQVYYGNSESTANCTAAVQATKGIVLMNGSQLTSTWYTASNGGQTESAANCWGSSGYDYLVVKDDPFDAANSLSTVRSFTVYGEYGAAAQSSALKKLLESKVQSAIGNASIRRIEGVTPHTPKYASPSRVYTKMDFDLVVEVNGTEQKFTVTCDIFGELESLMGLSINASQNELWTVTEKDGNFVIQSRRYGHGVGMSQRGAMRMGALGYTYDQILGFYYENCRRVQYTFTRTILSGVDDTTVETEENPAEITPAAVGQATVTLPSVKDTTALRSAKQTNAAILMQLDNGTIVTPLAKETDWTLVRFGSLVGYVKTDVLKFSGDVPDTSDETVTTVTQWATVNCNGTLNLRSKASFSADVLTTIPNGEILAVFDVSGGFAHVQYGAHTGYASTDFLRLSTTYPEETEDSTTTAYAAQSAVLRASASTTATVLANVTQGTQVSILSDDGSWCMVRVNEMTGYLRSSSLTRQQAEATAAPTTTVAETSNITEAIVATAGETAMVYDAPSETANVISAMLRGESVRVTEKGENWCTIRYGSLEGSMRTTDLQFVAENTETTVIGYARVVTPSGSLNMRSKPKAGSEILTTIPRLTQVTVLALQDSWAYVQYQDLQGWVMQSFLSMNGAETTAEPSATATTAAYALVKTPSGSLNLREKASTKASVLTTIPRLTQLQVTSRANGWAQVTYNGVTGWVMENYLSYAEAATPTPSATENVATVTDLTPAPTAESTPAPTATPASETGSEAFVRTGGGSLNLRQQARSGSTILLRIPEYAVVRALAWGSTWTCVQYQNTMGYVQTKYLSTAASTQGNTAKVVTPSGALNLRGLPSTGGKILAQINPGEEVNVLRAEADWCRISYDGMVGYVKTEFLQFASGMVTATPTAAVTTESTATPVPETTVATAVPTASVRYAWVTTPSGYLNLRTGPSTKNGVMGQLKPGTRVVVLSATADGWAQVQTDTKTGYVQSKFLTEKTDTPNVTATSAPEEDDGDTGDVRYVVTSIEYLNMRASASETASVVAAIPKGWAVRVLEAGATWCKIRYDQQTGYVMTKYLTGSAGSQATSSVTAVPTATATEAPTATAEPTQTPVIDVTLRDAGNWQAAVAGDVRETELRSWCAEDAPTLATLTTADSLTLLRMGDEWCYVSAKGKQGYVETNALALWQEVDTP